MWPCERCSDSAGLWDRGWFLRHAGGQNQASTPSTISVFSLLLHFHSLALLSILLRLSWKHSLTLNLI